jgi:hypothetical protein
MKVKELKDKLEGLPDDAVVSFGTNGNDAIIALCFFGLVAYVFWLLFGRD